MSKTLYIIGNGFDLYHGLDTWYSSFGLFLRDNHRDIYKYFINYLSLPELDEEDIKSLLDPLWSNFEASLADLDIDEVMRDHDDFKARPGSNDFKDGDWHTIEVMVSDIRDALTIKMLDSFKTFINNVDYLHSLDDRILEIDQDAAYLNFNYTRTLDQYYKIPSTNILYIHNKADGNDPLILGHGINPEKLKKEKEKPPVGLSHEELEEWRDEKAKSYDLSIENGKLALIEYFIKSFKSTAEILKNNSDYFDALGNVTKVIVLGHSLSAVDKPYITKVISSINTNANWIVSYHNLNEIEARKKRLIELGLREEQISLITINELRKKK